MYFMYYIKKSLKIILLFPETRKNSYSLPNVVQLRLITWCKYVASDNSTDKTGASERKSGVSEPLLTSLSCLLTLKGFFRNMWLFSLPLMRVARQQRWKEATQRKLLSNESI